MIKNSDSNNKISFRDYWKLMAKHKRALIGSPITCMIIALVVVLVMPEEYRGVAYLRILVPPIEKNYAIPNQNLTTTLTGEHLIQCIGHVDSGKKSSIFKNNADSVLSFQMLDMVTAGDMVKVKIRVNKPDVLENTLASLQNYIQNLDCVKYFLEQSKNHAKWELEKVARRMRVNDYLIRKNMQFFKKESRYGISPIGLYQMDSTLRIKRQLLESVIKHLDNLQDTIRLEELTISRYPLSPRAIIVLAGITGFLIGFFLVFLLEYLERLKTQHEI